MYVYIVCVCVCVCARARCICILRVCRRVMCVCAEGLGGGGGGRWTGKYRLDNTCLYAQVNCDRAALLQFMQNCSGRYDARKSCQQTSTLLFH